MKTKILLYFLMVFVVASIAHAQCQVTSTAMTTKDFIASLPALNKQLNTCALEMDSKVGWLLNDHTVEVTITMKDTTTTQLYVPVKNNKISSIATTGTGTGYTVEMQECAVNAALATNNPLGGVAALYEQGLVTVKANTFGKKVALGMFKPFISMAAKSMSVPVTAQC